MGKEGIQALTIDLYVSVCMLRSTREVWRALKGRKSCSRHGEQLLSECSPNFPSTSHLDLRT